MIIDIILASVFKAKKFYFNIYMDCNLVKVVISIRWLRDVRSYYFLTSVQANQSQAQNM